MQELFCAWRNKKFYRSAFHSARPIYFDTPPINPATYLGLDKKYYRDPGFSDTILLMPVAEPIPHQEVLDPEWIVPVAEKAKAYIDQSKAPNTVRAYRADWIHFSQWCEERNLRPLPAEVETVVLYLKELAGHAKTSTLGRRLSAISQAHQTAGLASPTREPVIRQLISGIRRSHGIAVTAKRPVLVEDLKAMLEGLPAGVLGFRDRALLLLGFTGAFRRSELVALDCVDIERQHDGLIVNVRRSTTDTEGSKRRLAIPHGNKEEGTCPVAAVEVWLAAAGIESGPVFRVVNRHGHVLPNRLSGEAVALVVKRRVEALGYDPAQFAGHSLRAGLATSAAMAGKSEGSIMQQTGHRSSAAVRRYIREGNLFRDNAAGGLGL